MPTESQAELFIRTLSELRDDERETQRARIRMQIRDYVNRFVKEFRTDLKGSGSLADWTPKPGGQAHNTARRGEVATAEPASPSL